MAHPLISTIVIALALAWVFGALAHRLRLQPLVGYLIAVSVVSAVCVSLLPGGWRRPAAAE